MTPASYLASKVFDTFDNTFCCRKAAIDTDTVFGDFHHLIIKMIKEEEEKSSYMVIDYALCFDIVNETVLYVSKEERCHGFGF